jgi:hypothetical protein
MKMHKQLGALARLAQKFRLRSDPVAGNVVIAPGFGPEGHGIAYARLSAAGAAVDLIVDLQPGQISAPSHASLVGSVMISPEYLAAAIASAEGRTDPALVIDEEYRVGGFAGEATEQRPPNARGSCRASVPLNDNLKRVARFASRRDRLSRGWIESIYVDPRERRIAATNGHYLAVGEIEHGDVNPVVVPVAVFDAAVTLGCRSLSITSDREHQEFWGDGIVIRFTPINAGEYSTRTFQIAETVSSEGRAEFVIPDLAKLAAHAEGNVSKGKAVRAKATAVVTRLAVGAGYLNASSTVNGMGETTAALTVEHHRQPRPEFALVVGFRSSYLADAIKATREADGSVGQVRFYLDRVDPRGSVAGFKGGALTIALMPCRLDD